MKKLIGVVAVISLLLVGHSAQARSTKNKTFGLYGLGNIQLIDTLPEIDPGPGGGLYFDYRFNQRFSLTVDAWFSIHDGTDRSSGDNDIVMMGIPSVTVKIYFFDDESSKWDPYAGIGVGLYALTEGSASNGTNGVGLGARLDVGVDYYLNDTFSLGFNGTFHSASIISGLGSNSNASATVIYALMGRFGYHF